MDDPLDRFNKLQFTNDNFRNTFQTQYLHISNLDDVEKNTAFGSITKWKGNEKWKKKKWFMQHCVKDATCISQGRKGMSNYPNNQKNY